MEITNVIPIWLDKNFLVTILQEGDASKQINIISFKAKPAVAAGNNYCCVVLRVTVEYDRNNQQPEQISLIVKTPLPSGPGKELVEQLGLIEKECLIYKELIPIMNKIFNKNICPKNYDCQIPQTLILDDLKALGFVMNDRLEQLDFNHCEVFMKKISTFHALSLQIHKNNPELVEKAGAEFYFKLNSRPQSQKHYFNGFHSFATNLETWEGFEKYSDFIKNNVSTLWDKVVEICNGKKHIRVLNHSDTWTNNILFKNDDKGKVIDAQLIDLQLCRFASPAVDIVTFLVTSAQEDVKRYRLSELYKAYLDSFNSTLEAIGCDERLSLEQLHDELKFVEPFLFALLPVYLPMVLCEKDNVMDMDKHIEMNKDSNDNKNKLWNGEHCKRVTKYSIKTLEEQGFFKSFK